MSDEWKGLNLAELLDLLEPVPEPATVPMTPQTAGWIWLGLVLLAGLTVLATFLFRRWQRNAYRREALRRLKGAGGDPAELSALIRRTALAGYPRTNVASLQGAEWLAFLDKSYGGTGFTKGPGALLAVAPYRSSSAAPDLTHLLKTWIRTHRRSVP